MFRNKNKKYLRKKMDFYHDYMVFGMFLAGGYLFFKLINKKLISEEEDSKKTKQGFFLFL